MKFASNYEKVYASLFIESLMPAHIRKLEDIDRSAWVVGVVELLDSGAMTVDELQKHVNAKR